MEVTDNSMCNFCYMFIILTLISEGKTIKQGQKTSVYAGNSSYIWKNNSCWLDTALELLHVTISYNFKTFLAIYETLPAESAFHYLYHMLQKWQTLDSTTKGFSCHLSKQQDELCVKLVAKKVAHSTSSFEPLFVSFQFVFHWIYIEIIVQSWLWDLIAKDFEQTSYQFYSYFETLITKVHSCSGSLAMGCKHHKIQYTPQQCCSLELKHSEHEAY